MNLFSLMATIGIDDSRFTSGINRAEKSTLSFGAKIKKVGVGLAKMSAPFVAIGLASVKVGADFEAAMSKVGAISGATGNDLKKLKAKAEEMGAKTSKSATEAANALSYMALAGWDTNTSIGALEPVLRLSEAGGMDLALTSDLVTDSMAALGLKSKELPSYLDKIAKTSGKSNTSVQQLGEAMVIAGGTFKNLNTPMDEANAILGIMANRGLKGSEAGNSLNSIMINLTTGAGKAGKAMKKLNIKAFDGAGKFKGMGNVLKEVRDKTKDMTEEQRNMYLSMIGGKTQLTTLQALTAGVGDEFDSLQKDIKNSDGALNKMAKTMQDNLKGSITKLKSALEGLLIKLSDVFIPIAEKVVAKTQGIVNGFSTLIDKMKAGESFSQAFSEAFKGVIPDIAIQGIIKIKELFTWIIDNKDLIIAAILGIGVAFGVFKVVVLVQKLIEIYKAWTLATVALKLAQKALFLITSLNPFAIFVSLIAGAVVAIIYLWNTNEDFRNFWIEVWQNISDFFVGIWTAIIGFFTTTIPTTFNNFVIMLSEIPGKVAGFFSSIYNGFLVWGASVLAWVGTTVANIVKNIVTFFSKLPGRIKTLFTNIYNDFMAWGASVISWVATTIPKVVNNIFTFFNELPGKIGFVIGFVIVKIIKFGVDLIKWAIIAIPKFVATIVRFISQLPGKIWNFLAKIISDLIKWGVDMSVKGAIASAKFIAKVVSFIRQLPGKIWNLLVKIISNIGTWGSNMASKGASAARRFIISVIKFFSQLPSKIRNFLVRVISNIGTWGSNMASKGSSAAKKLVNSVVNGVKSLPGKMLDIGRNIVRGLWNGISNMIGWLHRKVGEFMGGIVKGARKAIEVHSPSRVFARDVGEYIPMGIDKGINKRMPSTIKNLKDQLNDMVATVNPTIKNGGQLATTTAGITVKNNMYGMDFSNYESTGRQIENNIERARWKIK